MNDNILSMYSNITFLTEGGEGCIFKAVDTRDKSFVVFKIAFKGSLEADVYYHQQKFNNIGPALYGYHQNVRLLPTMLGEVEKHREKLSQKERKGLPSLNLNGMHEMIILEYFHTDLEKYAHLIETQSRTDLIHDMNQHLNRLFQDIMNNDIVQYDFKPQNVLVNYDDHFHITRMVVTDFSEEFCGPLHDSLRPLLRPVLALGFASQYPYEKHEVFKEFAIEMLEPDKYRSFEVVWRRDTEGLDFLTQPNISASIDYIVSAIAHYDSKKVCSKICPTLFLESNQVIRNAKDIPIVLCIFSIYYIEQIPAEMLHILTHENIDILASAFLNNVSIVQFFVQKMQAPGHITLIRQLLCHATSPSKKRK